MQRFWLTAHWPPLLSKPSDTFNIYIQDIFRNVVEEMHVGDRVLIYEMAGGPAARRLEDGLVTVIKRHVGAQAIIRDARIATEIHERPGYSPETFDG